MHIREIMTADPITITPEKTLREASELMRTADIGILPIGENDQLVGALTDRDIVVRGLALGHGPDTPVRDAMSTDVLYCFDDEEVSAVAENLGDQKLRRLPVVNRSKRLVGLVSLGDVALQEDTRAAGDTLREIVQDSRTAS
ncbi:Hypoxic response protein 1 [Roseivivax jejudonensis]|uniref:Hypoxic response protein 1 n=1 Tax=Roseivivax jejudonensis TaxID=1529041 RepID=A0A1X6Y477_9RHOB|nr:CBS domain-containing protein [Roseivivax jejudonensis]SLN09983.1 Hypoxic response protein 1 [Roseivivax jejudonensis]